MSEREVHKAIIQHLETRAFADVEWMHVNNTPRSPKHGAFLKSLGSRRGAPDLIYFLPKITIAHEIKTEIGKLSKHQKEFLQRLRSLGVEILVTYGLDDALRQLNKLGILRGESNAQCGFRSESAMDR